MLNIILPILLFLSSVFLILLVLIQRGRGGGLAGAFGGLGGQSAFGTKAGDLFTRITIVVATVWILLCAASVKLLNNTGQGLLSNQLGATSAKSSLDDAASKAPADAKGGAPADGKAAAPATDGKAPAEGAAPPAEAPAAEAPAAAPAAGEAPAAEAPAKSE
jgi:preprotein translocase subunit SecG